MVYLVLVKFPPNVYFHKIDNNPIILYPQSCDHIRKTMSFIFLKIISKAAQMFIYEYVKNKAEKGLSKVFIKLKGN